MAFTPQTTVTANPPIAHLGMHADTGFKDTISRLAAVACSFGRVVVGDEKTCEPPDSAADVTHNSLGVAMLDSMVAPTDPPYPATSAVPVMREGRIWAEVLSGAAPQHGDSVYVYRGATTANRGKVTQDGAAADVTLLAGASFTGKTMSGGAEVQLDGIGTSKSAGLEGEYGFIPLPLFAWREVSSGGDVGAIAAIGGVLASDTTPILRGDSAEAQEIHWAAGNSDIIAQHFIVPTDFDGSYDVRAQLFVRTDNTGGGGIEAATFTVETGWDGGALVSDAATDTTPAITLHPVEATIAAADIPDAPSVGTIFLTLGTHANDPVQLLGARLIYRKKAA